MMGALLFRGTAFALVWWVLAEGRADSWGVGAVSVAAAVAASLYLAPPGLGWLSPAGLLAFAGYFLFESLRGSIQVAAMALRPRMDLAPAQVNLPLRLPPGPATVLLVSTLSLMPGTLSVRLEAHTLCLHVLDGRLPVEDEVRTAETRIARMFGVTL